MLSLSRPRDPAAASPWRFCVAPMMDWTDRHCRFFHRQISRHARLYTEMVTTGALLHGDAARHLAFDPVERPLALQLGGNDPAALARCARLAEDTGYDEVNLNCGCPSDRVQNGAFGACLMRQPERVAEAVAAMRAATRLPVTVKCRIGVDNDDHPEFLHRFVDTVAAAGCSVFIIHARKAWLQGLSPRQNREVPPLHYDRVEGEARRRPDLHFVLNGGLQSLDAIDAALGRLPGVMVGRAVYEQPWLLADVDRRLFGASSPAAEPDAVIAAMRAYIAAQNRAGIPTARITRHMLGLHRGAPGARVFRRVLGEAGRQADAGPEVLDMAVAAMQQAAQYVAERRSRTQGRDARAAAAP